MKVGIAMIPDLEMLESLVELQKKILRICPLSPLLETQQNLPHITLLQGRFRNQINWMSLILELQDYCHRQKYSLELKDVELEYKPSGWYFLKFPHNYMFHGAHRFVFEQLKDSLFLTEEDRQKKTSHYSYLEKINYFSYGYRYIGDAFQPHITLGRTFDNRRMNDEAALTHLVESLSSNLIGTIQKITIYEVGDNGSHAATLYYVNM